MKLNNRKLANPFIYQGYESPEYFCDSENALQTCGMCLKKDTFRTFKAHFLKYRFIFGLFRILFSLLFIATNVKNLL